MNVFRVADGVRGKPWGHDRHGRRTQKSEQLSIADFDGICNGEERENQGLGIRAQGLGIRGWREEKAEDVGEAGGPGGFVVEGVGDAEVVEVGAVALG